MGSPFNKIICFGYSNWMWTAFRLVLFTRCVIVILWGAYVISFHNLFAKNITEYFLLKLISINMIKHTLLPRTLFPYITYVYYTFVAIFTNSYTVKISRVCSVARIIFTADTNALIVCYNGIISVGFLVNKKKSPIRLFFLFTWCSRQDLNPQHFGSKPNALSSWTTRA